MAYKIQTAIAACLMALSLSSEITQAKEPTELNFDARNAEGTITHVITNQPLMVVLEGKTIDCPDAEERIADAAASIPNMIVIFAKREAF